MCLSVDKIAENEQVMLSEALHHLATNDGWIDVCPMDKYLRFWAENKNVLYTLLGEKLIYTMDVDLQRNLGVIVSDMEVALNDHPFYDKMWKFSNDYAYYIYNLLNMDIINAALDNPESELGQVYAAAAQNMEYFREYALRFKNLALNVYEGPTFKIITPAGKIITINKGMKIMRIFNKIVSAFYPNQKEVFEDFKKEHSLCLNQKRLNGKLSLSIHPLDFATMSDNNCDWESCMSWQQYGDYRVGTVEMMNSPCVVCAYLESEKPMEYMGDKWNSKRWRQLFIVTPDLIFGIKGYPYDNPDLVDIVMKELRRLGETNMGWEFPHTVDTLDMARCGYQTLHDGRSIEFHLVTDNMYNDIRDIHYAYVGSKVPNGRFHLNFSGPAVCAECGEIIDWDETNELVCSCCSGMVRCADCGELISQNDAIYVDGTPYCDYCYNYNFYDCECCGDELPSDCAYYIKLKAWDSTLHECHLCECCFDKLEKEFDECMESMEYTYHGHTVQLEQVEIDAYDRLCELLGLDSDYFETTFIPVMKRMLDSRIQN